MDDLEKGATRFSWRGFALLMLAALVIRYQVLDRLSGNLDEDRDMYRAIADTIVKDGVYGYQLVKWKEFDDGYRFPLWSKTYPTAFRPPLYPFLLSLFAEKAKITPTQRMYKSTITSAQIFKLHLTLGLATVALSVLLAWRMGLGQGSLIVGALVACDPILLYWSSFAMTETLATLMSVVVLLVVHWFIERPIWWRAAIAGAICGVAMLCRPAFLAFFVLATIAVVMAGVDWRERLMSGLWFILCGILVLVPWTVRNHNQFGRPIFATTHGGYTLLLGNNDDFYEYLENGNSGEAWDPTEFQSEFQSACDAAGANNEVKRDRLAYSMAIKVIKERPAMFYWASIVRIGRLWNPLPYRVADQGAGRSDVVRYAIAVWYLALFLLMVAGVKSLAKPPIDTRWLWGILMCLAFTAVHTFYWSNIRMRAPLMPVICMLAVAGLHYLFPHIHQRRISKESVAEDVGKDERRDD